jgi:hypothetical protein
MPQAIRVIDRAADLADVATPFIDGRFLKWNNSTGKFETAQVSHAGLADLNGDHHNIYLRTDGMRAMTGRLNINLAGGEPAIRVTQAGVTTVDILSNGIFRAYPEEAYSGVFEVMPHEVPGWNPTFSVLGSGQISWGGGISPADVTLYRDQASRLRVGGDLRVGGNLYVDNTLATGRIYSTATSAATSSLIPAFQAGSFAGFGAVIAPNLETLVLYGYRYGNHPILMVSAKGYAADPYAPWDASASAWLTVLADGNIGIGTVLPTAKLDVIDGCIRVRNGNIALPTTGAGVELYMAGGDGHITAWDRGTDTGMPLYFYASSYIFNNAAVRCDSGFNVGGNAGFSGTIPAGRDIYVSGGIITGHS